MTFLITLILSVLFSIYSVQWVFLKILKISKIKNIVDTPNLRKLQKSPVPVLGGLAVFFGLLMGLLLFCAFSNSDNSSLSSILIAAGILLFLGAMDDILDLTPKSRIIIEIVVISCMIFSSGKCIDSLHGLWGIQEFSWWIAVPLTVFAGAGIINAYNMVDGVNGLSSGICITCSLIYSYIFLLRRDYIDCAVAACFSSSLLPFLIHNVFGKRSRMYIGDSGTMVMGIMMTWFSIQILSSTNTQKYVSSIGELKIGYVALALCIASVPIFDALRVIVLRLARGRSPFVGDKTHLHHMFVLSGFSHLFTSLSEILINVFVVLVWYVSYCLGMSIDTQLYVSIISSLIFVNGTYFFLKYHAKRHSKLFLTICKVSEYSQMEHKRWWIKLQHILDFNAFEDYRLIITNGNKTTLDNLTKAEIEESSLINYLQGRGTVKMSDLFNEGIVDSESIDPIVTSLIEKKILKCVNRDKLGKIEEIRIVNGSI